MQILALILLPITLAIHAMAEIPPYSPDKRLKIELFAEAPQIKHPTGLTIDSKGRVFVIESHTHFPPKDYAGQKKDRIYVFSKPGKDGKSTDRKTFAEGFEMGMDLLMARDGWLYVAERSRISRIRDTDNDLKADQFQTIIDLKTTGKYPHNGLAGLSFDSFNYLYFGLGENLGHPYHMIGSDGKSIKGAEGIGGGIFRCKRDGSGLESVARGLWNPFGLCVDEFGRVLRRPTIQEDLHAVYYTLYLGVTMATSISTDALGIIIPCWNGELSNTLPMVCGVGGPCEILLQLPNFPEGTEESTLLPLGATTAWNDINSMVEETPWVAKWKR